MTFKEELEERLQQAKLRRAAPQIPQKPARNNLPPSVASFPVQKLTQDDEAKVQKSLKFNSSLSSDLEQKTSNDELNESRLTEKSPKKVMETKLLICINKVI